MDEQQVLDEFLHSEPTMGVLVAPVLGESGTGKSHLVRWVEAKIDVKKSGRHVIYLRKTDTSLKNVVEQLLVGQEGPEVRRDPHEARLARQWRHAGDDGGSDPGLARRGGRTS